MSYSYNNVMKVIQNIEEEVLFDVEASEYWYEIEFKNDTLSIYEIDEYHYNGYEIGEIEVEKNETIIKDFECSLKDFTNFVIQFFKDKVLYMQTSYPQEMYISNKIIIRTI